MLVLPPTADVVSGFIDAAAAAPDHLSTIANVMTAPPMPFLPEEIHGRPVLLAMLFHSGTPGSAEVALAPFRALGPPLMDTTAPMRYPEIVEAVGEGFAPAVVATNMFVDEIAETRRCRPSSTASPSPGRDLAVVQVRVLGGAVARVPDDATAFAHRRRKLMVNVAAVDFDRGGCRSTRPGSPTSPRRIRGDQDAGAYIGFLEDERARKVRAAYPNSTWDRLAEVKRSTTRATSSG